MGDRRGPTLRPSRRGRAAPDTETYQDSKCLSRLLLSTWAWHPLCPISRSGDTVPVEFGSHGATDSEAVEEYKRFFRPFIVEEALASVLKEAEDEVRDKQSMQIRFRSIIDIGEGRADVSCVLVNNRKKNVGRKLKEGNLVFLLNIDPSAAKTGLRELCSRCTRTDSTKVAVFAGWVKYCGRVESDGLLLEVQHARSPETTARPDKDKNERHPGDMLSNVLMTALEDSGNAEPGKWYIVSSSAPVTSQREMAALEAMSRRDDVHLILRPSLALEGQGGSAHRIWPEQLGFKPYIDYIKGCHDITQLEAVEACAALCASPQAVTKFVSKAKPIPANPSLLPIILIQGPPGTGKTHTVKLTAGSDNLTAFHGRIARPPLGGITPDKDVFLAIDVPRGISVRTVLNSWHLCQFQRFNDVQYQRLQTLLQERKAAQASSGGASAGAGSAGGYKRPRNGAAGTGSQDPLAIIAASNREVSAAATSAAAAEDLAVSVTTEKAPVVPRPRILVCAPSNAATDELLKRVLEGRFVDVHGRPYSPRVARIGSESAAMSDSARKVWVDKNVADMLDNTSESQANTKILHTESLQRSAMEQRTLAIQRLSFEGISGEDRNQTVSDYISAENKLAQLNNNHNMWTTVHAYLNQATSRWDAEEMLAASYMESAEIVFTTLSSTGRRAFERGRRFDLVLIDEAAQASEAATLQPLTLGSGRLVLVGDPRQLPATILSKRNQRLAFDRSLFQRLMDAGWPVRMLSVQYRMHPHIRRFPGKHFYDDELTDGHSVTARPMQQFYAHDLFKPYVVYDVSHGRDRTASAGSGSRWNLGEINMALALFQELRQYLVSLMQKAAKDGTPRPQPCTVGVITPYREQCRRMKQAFEEVLGASVAKEVKIDTVDSFQGKQMDVIIMSCVRASGGDHSSSSNARALLGFVEDVRRMNVGITRARHALWLLGNAKTLSINEHWRALFEDARTYIKGGCVIEDADAEQLFPEAKLWDPSKTPPKKPGPKQLEDSAREDRRSSAEPGAPSTSAAKGWQGQSAPNRHGHHQQVALPQGQGGAGPGVTLMAAAPPAVNALHSGPMHAPVQGGTTHIGGVHVPPENRAQLAAEMHGLANTQGSSRPPSQSQVPAQVPGYHAQQHHMQQHVTHHSQQLQHQQQQHAQQQQHTQQQQQQHQQGAGKQWEGAKLEMKLPDLASQRQGAGAAVFSGHGRTAGAFGAPAPSQFTNATGPHAGSNSSSTSGVGQSQQGWSNTGAPQAKKAVVPKALSRDPRRRAVKEESTTKDPRMRAVHMRTAPMAGAVTDSKRSLSPANDKAAEDSRGAGVGVADPPSNSVGGASMAPGAGEGLQQSNPSAMQDAPARNSSPRAAAPTLYGANTHSGAAAAAPASPAAAKLKVETTTVKQEDEMDDDIASARGMGSGKAGNQGGKLPSPPTVHTSVQPAGAGLPGPVAPQGAAKTAPWNASRPPPPDRAAPQRLPPRPTTQHWQNAPPPTSRAPGATAAAPSPTGVSAAAPSKHAAPPDIALQRSLHTQRASAAPGATARASGGALPPPDLLHGAPPPPHTATAVPPKAATGGHAPPDLVMGNSWGSTAPPHSTAGGAAPPRHITGMQGAHGHLPRAPAGMPVPQTHTQAAPADDDFVDVADLKRPRTALQTQAPAPWAGRGMHTTRGRGTGSHRTNGQKPPPWMATGKAASAPRQYGGATARMQAPHASAHTYKASHAMPPDVQGHAGVYSMGTAGGGDDDEDIAARRKLHKAHPAPVTLNPRLVQGAHQQYPPSMGQKPHPPPGSGMGMPPPPDLLHLQ